MSIRIEDLEKTAFEDVVEAGEEEVAPTRPGDILRHEFMEPFGLSANALARALSVPPNRITGILKGSRRLTADTALRLARYFGTTPHFWLNLQEQYDLTVTAAEQGERIEHEVEPRGREGVSG
ncbi:MAG TPA: HigA family addiction module antitoxin [Gammaproteobacteria bacterium]|nr:HigA family addiction module antitoxin [Gammaproteobacteria bacterium]